MVSNAFMRSIIKATWQQGWGGGVHIQQFLNVPLGGEDWAGEGVGGGEEEPQQEDVRAQQRNYYS